VRLALSLVLVALIAPPLAAQPGQQDRCDRDRYPERCPTDAPPKGWKPPVLDMGGMHLDGRLRTPQLLYFLERADEELERASLERRSFIPELVRTIGEEAL